MKQEESHHFSCSDCLPLFRKHIQLDWISTHCFMALCIVKQTVSAFMVSVNRNDQAITILGNFAVSFFLTPALLCLYSFKYYYTEKM